MIILGYNLNFILRIQNTIALFKKYLCNISCTENFAIETGDIHTFSKRANNGALSEGNCSTYVRFKMQAYNNNCDHDDLCKITSLQCLPKCGRTL